MTLLDGLLRHAFDLRSATSSRRPALGSDDHVPFVIRESGTSHFYVPEVTYEVLLDEALATKALGAER